MEKPVEFCEYGNRCNGCPMIGQPKAVLDALNIAVPTVGDRRFMPGEAARVAVRAMREAGFEGPLFPTSQAVTKAVERIAVHTKRSGVCPIYDVTQAHEQDSDSGEEVHESDV